MKTKRIVYVAMYLALFYVLDSLTKVIPILKMPQGGSVGLSVVALLLASYHLGWKSGVLVGVLSLFLQYLTGDVWVVHPIQFLLDYPIAFGVYGLAVLFPNTKIGPLTIYWGILLTGAIRLLCHVVTGALYWEATWPGSLSYNAPYMIATTALALVVVPILVERLKLSGK